MLHGLHLETPFPYVTAEAVTDTDGLLHSVICRRPVKNLNALHKEIEVFGGQFLDTSVPRHQVDPLYGVLPGVPDLLHGPFQRVDLLQKLGLLRLILIHQPGKVVVGDTPGYSRSNILVTSS